MATRTEKGNCFMNSYDDTADHTPRKGANDIEYATFFYLFDDSTLMTLMLKIENYIIVYIRIKFWCYKFQGPLVACSMLLVAS